MHPSGGGRKDNGHRKEEILTSNSSVTDQGKCYEGGSLVD